MKLPRTLSANKLAQALSRLGYQIVSQTGPHMRLTTQQGGEHHVTLPRHRVLKKGTLNGILKDVAEHAGLTRTELLDRLFG